MNDEFLERIRREVRQYSPRQMEPEWIPNPANYCTGVKAIGSYLEDRLGRTVSERTVSRWMRFYGLPCHKAGGWIIARKDELEAWLEERSPSGG
jgi:hypothetical protein